MMKDNEDNVYLEILYQTLHAVTNIPSIVFLAFKLFIFNVLYNLFFKVTPCQNLSLFNLLNKYLFIQLLLIFQNPWDRTR